MCLLNTIWLTLCRKIKVGKLFVSPVPIIGTPYGSMFQPAADNRSIERMVK